MAMTEQDRAWHETYEQMDPEVKTMVDRAVEAAQRHLRLVGLVTAQDDRAEQLVAAMARYVVLSNPHTSSLLINRLSPIAAAETVAIVKAPEIDANERHIRTLLTEVAIKHKDLFGTADTKQAIRKYGHSLSLRDVPLECVPGLHRVLQGAIDRARSAAVKDERQMGMNPNLAAPYGRSVDTPHGRQPVVTHDDPPLWQETPQYGWPQGTSLNRADDDDSTKVAGAGGSFDGGGASGSWDTTPSETNPPTGD